MQRITHRLLRVPVLFLVLALISPVFAQTFRGGINGTVTDVTGAVVPSAHVIVIETSTAAAYNTVSSSAGEFLLNDLPLGSYTVMIDAPGFSKLKFDKVPVSAGVLYTLPVKLTAASSDTIIEVNAAAITLDTTTATNNTVLDAKAVADIPLNSRDFTQMIQLTPGYAGYSGGGYGSLNGTRANQMNWQIDGVDNNDLWHNIPAVNQSGVSGIAGIILPLDAVDQFSAQTQSGPEGGRNPGGTINLTLRAGTNSLHGTAYYFNRNELFGAKSPFSVAKQKVRNYNTGFSLGGPLLQDKLFGFLTFEHQRFVIGQSGTTTLPSVGWQAQANAILAANNLAINPVMLNVLNTVYGANNLAQDTAGVKNNFHSNDPEFGYSWNGLGKVDWRVSGRDNVSVHWFMGQGNQVAPVGSQLLAFYEVAPIHVQNIAVVYNRMIDSHISNQLLAGVNSFNQKFSDNDTNYNVQSLGFITGAPYTNAPHLAIGSFNRVGETPPEGRIDITGHLTDQLSWIKGKHQMRFGGEYRKAQIDEFYHRHAVGTFTFDGSRIGGNDPYAGALANFLAGRTSDASIAIGDPERLVYVNTWFLNAGDTWEINPRLTVNYGVRYDFEGPLHDGKKDLSVFRPALTSSAGLAIQGAQTSTLYQRYFKSFSPRVGASYSMDDKTVLRAGFGFYFDTPNLNPFLDNRPGNSAPNGVEGNPVGSNPVYTVDVGEVTIQQGVPVFPTALAGSPCAPATPCGIFSVDSSFRSAYNENYSVNIEKTLAPNVIAQFGYVGSEGRRLLSLLDINQAAPGVYANAAARQTARPYYGTYPQYGNINQIESIGTSNYNALQTEIRLQNWHRLSASATYTWSHNLDEVTAYRGALPQDSNNFKANYSNSDFDTRNTYVSFVSYQLPGLAHGFRALSNGWQVNSLMNFHGGQPFTVYATGDLSGTNEGNDRAVQIAPVHTGYQGQKPKANWIDLSAFQDPVPGTFGTTRRNAYYGPGFSDVDFSVFKDTKIKERVTVQFRAEMFNLFNRVNYAPPNSNSVSVGGSSNLNDTIGDYNGAPGIGAGEAFNTQFGLKILF